MTEATTPVLCVCGGEAIIAKLCRVDYPYCVRCTRCVRRTMDYETAEKAVQMWNMDVRREKKGCGKTEN